MGKTLHGNPAAGPGSLRFWKGHALGNDYIVVEGAELPSTVIRSLCDRHRGVGSDGVLVGDAGRDPVGLRIFNPDGTEAEKSGNGLRIFGAWLHDRGAADGDLIRVSLPSETVEMRVVGAEPGGAKVLRVAMGRASFRAADVHFADADPAEEVVAKPLTVGEEIVAVHLVSMGNPHCVVFTEPLDDGAFRGLAPRLQALPAFRQGVNVQFARVAGPDVLEALIWERGAGETMASGSSACAVVAAAVRSGRVSGHRFQVRMTGGAVEVEIGDDWTVHLTGSAQVVYEGTVPGRVVQAWETAR